MSRPPLAVLAREDPAARPAGREHAPAVTGEPSDEDLMARVVAGDHVAFRGLMGRHMRRAIRIAQGILGSAADADDVAQEAFLRVWKAGPFDPARARFTTWMHQIVVNLAIDRTRAPRTEPTEHAEHVHDGAPDALIALMAAQERHTMQQALAQLNSEHHRAAITLFHFEGLSGRDSAQAMSLSEAAFESPTRARAALKQHVHAALGNRGRRE